MKQSAEYNLSINLLNKKQVLWKQLKRYRMLFLMMLPGFFYLLLNNYLPMMGVVIAFKNVNFTKGIFKSDWCGFDNFKFIFRTDDAFIITRNTLGYNIIFILVNLFLAVTLAILLNEVLKQNLKKFYQSALILPYFLSMVIVAYLVYSFLNPESGFINRVVLPLFGIEPIDWYFEPKYWPFILVFVNAWKGVGYSSVIYIAAITGIDQEYYEAATIDGASKWKQTKHITLPLLVPVITTMTILAIGRIFYSDFGLFYQIPMESGKLIPVTNTIDTYVFRGLLQMGDIGMSSAAGLYQSFVGFVLVLITSLIIRKFSPENSLF